MIGRSRSLLAVTVLGLALLFAMASPASADPGDAGWSSQTSPAATSDPGDAGWQYSDPGDAGW